jgi:hypothetical protein
LKDLTQNLNEPGDRKKTAHRQIDDIVALSHLHCHWPTVISAAVAPAYLLERNRNEFVITDTELKLIASAAIIGDNSQPVSGYSNPAASGMPSAL